MSCLIGQRLITTISSLASFNSTDADIERARVTFFVMRADTLERHRVAARHFPRAPHFFVEADQAAMQMVRAVVDGESIFSAIDREAPIGDPVRIAADDRAEVWVIGQVTTDRVEAEDDVGGRAVAIGVVIDVMMRRMNRADLDALAVGENELLDRSAVHGTKGSLARRIRCDTPCRGRNMSISPNQPRAPAYFAGQVRRSLEVSRMQLRHDVRVRTVRGRAGAAPLPDCAPSSSCRSLRSAGGQFHLVIEGAGQLAVSHAVTDSATLCRARVDCPAPWPHSPRRSYLNVTDRSFPNVMFGTRRRELAAGQRPRQRRPWVSPSTAAPISVVALQAPVTVTDCSIPVREAVRCVALRRLASSLFLWCGGLRCRCRRFVVCGLCVSAHSMS